MIDRVAELVGAVAPLILAAAYLVRARTLRGQGRAVPAWRQLSFGFGMVIILVAVGPLEGKASELVLAHMAQHILLADLASLLIVFGLTGPIMQPLLRNQVAHALRFLTHPVVAISLFTFNLFLWHSPPLYQAVLDSVPLHEAEHLSFIATGILLWMPLFGPLPKPQWFGKAAHVLYTVGIWLPAMVLANVLMWADVVFYPAYSATSIAAGIEPIADQSTAGAILMGECTILALCIFAWVFLRWAKEDIEKQDLLDLAIDRHFDLTPDRAARAVAAGRGAELRARIEAGGPPTSPATGSSGSEL